MKAYFFICAFTASTMLSAQAPSPATDTNKCVQLEAANNGNPQDTTCHYSTPLPDLSKIYGKIKYVTAFADYKVKVVRDFADLHVKIVSAFADGAGKWKIVDNFPDFTIQLVDDFPDFTIKYVDNFPGPQ